VQRHPSELTHDDPDLVAARHRHPAREFVSRNGLIPNCKAYVLLTVLRNDLDVDERA
jgi:hypothetical protein